MTLQELRDALAKATQADRWLDAEILVTLKIITEKWAKPGSWLWIDTRASISYGEPVIRITEAKKRNAGDRPIDSYPAYTASLDAAVTLVPPAAWKETNGPRRLLHLPSSSPNFWHCEITTWGPMRMAHGWGATEALALCAARVEYELAKLVKETEE